MDIDLMGEVVDKRFGGNVEAAASALVQMQANLDYMGGRATYYRKVGNQCLVFFSNDKAARICEENPDNIRGIIVSDYDTVIEPGAVVIGSVLDHAFIDRSSEVTHSNLVYSTVKRTIVDGSLMGTCYDRWTAHDSTVQDSWVSTSGLSGAFVNRSAVTNSMINDEGIEDMNIYFDKRLVDLNMAASLLERTHRRDLPRL